MFQNINRTKNGTVAEREKYIRKFKAYNVKSFYSI